MEYKMHRFNHFNICNSAILGTSTVWCNHHHDLLLEYFHHPQKEIHTHSAVSPHSSLPPPWQPRSHCTSL